MSRLSLVPPTAGAPASTYKELLEVFLDSKAARTREAYQKDIGLFAHHCDLSPAESVESLLSNGSARANLTVASWKNQMMVANLASATINRRLAAIKSLATTANDYGISDVAIVVKNEPPRPRRDTRGPELEAVRKMMRRLESNDSVRGRRDHAVIRLLLDLALRRQEVSDLTLEALDITGGALVVVGKGRIEEVITLPSPTMRALRRWLEVRGLEPGPLFPGRDGVRGISGSTIYRIVRDNGGLRPHGLRHLAITTAARAAAREGLGLHDVQSFSRHRDMFNLFSYLDDDKDAQEKLSSVVAESTT